MKNSLLTTLALSLILLTMKSSFALDNNPVPDKRSKLRTCDTHLSLCKDVADIDHGNCQPTGRDCDGEYIEDRKECASDYASCVGRIRRVLLFNVIKPNIGKLKK